MRDDRSDTSAIRRILSTLVDQQRRLRSTGAPAAEVEANRKAIAYWHNARSAVREEAPTRVEPVNRVD